jgi:hypothetical protein
LSWPSWRQGHSTHPICPANPICASYSALVARHLEELEYFPSLRAYQCVAVASVNAAAASVSGPQPEQRRQPFAASTTKMKRRMALPFDVVEAV